MSVLEKTPPESVSTGPRTPTRAAVPRGARKSHYVVLLFAVVALGFGGYLWWQRPATSAPPAVLTYQCQPETFDVKIPLNGELKAIKNVEIRSQVEGVTTILYIVPEGTRVSKGDPLVRLASDQIKDRLEDFKIRVENDKAAMINSRELVDIQKLQNDSDIKLAEMNAALSQLEYQQFVKGDAIIERETRKTALENATLDLDRKKEDLARVKELKKLDYVSGNDVLDAEMAFRDARNKLETARMNVDVWKNYAEVKQLESLTRKKEESARELERTRKKAAANLLLREADLRAKEQTLHVDETRMKSLEEQVAACEIRAPHEGMVVYQSSVTGSANQAPIEEGAQVRLNQTIIQLPDTSRMQVEVRLAEQLIERVKHGQESVITVDAIPGRVFHGKIESIATLPDNANRWLNPNLKEYITYIPLDDKIDQTKINAKPGMSAKVEILIKHLEDAVAVPVQAVFSSAGNPYVFVGTPENWAKRNITPGLASSTKVEIVSGLSLGESVLLSRPKSAPEDAAPPGAKRKKGKGGPTTAPAVRS